MKQCSQFTWREINVGPCFPPGSVLVPKKPRQVICEEKNGRELIKYPTFPRNRTQDISWILVSVNSLAKCNLMQRRYQPMRLMQQPSCLCFLLCGRREITSIWIRHTSHLHFPDHIQEHTTDNSFPLVQWETRWLQKTHFSSKAAYGILINNRLIDLSPFKNLIC